jgi:hypothetical protein
VFDVLYGNARPKIDSTFGDPLARNLVEAGNHGNIDALMSGLSPVRTGRWDDRAYYVSLAARTLIGSGRVDMLPDTPLGNLIRVEVRIHLAWKARGSGPGETVSDDGWKQFFKELDLAGRYLVYTGEQDLEDPTPYALLQTVAKGLQLDRDIAVAWLDEALRRDPLNQYAHFRHLTLVCEKWGGTHEEMFAFARATLRKLPPGSELGAILFAAFLEYVLYYKGFEPSPEKLDALRSSPKVRDESLAVYRTFLESRNIESVSDYYLHNLAVCWFDILNIPEVIRQEVKKIGPHVTPFPWMYFFRDPVQAYQRIAKR